MGKGEAILEYRIDAIKRAFDEVALADLRQNQMSRAYCIQQVIECIEGAFDTYPTNTKEEVIAKSWAMVAKHKLMLVLGKKLTFKSTKRSVYDCLEHSLEELLNIQVARLKEKRNTPSLDLGKEQLN